MSPSGAKTTLKYFLQALSKLLFAVAGLSFFFGGRAIHEFGNVDRVLAEFLGITTAVVCGFGAYIATRKIEDIEWEKANQEALEEESEKQGQK